MLHCWLEFPLGMTSMIDTSQIGIRLYLNKVILTITNIIKHKNISSKVSVDFFEFREQHKEYLADKVLIFTGPIDHYFADKGMERLEYRSIDFVVERYKNMNYY